VKKTPFDSSKNQLSVRNSTFQFTNSNSKLKGRCSTYSHKIAQLICEMLSEGISLRAICRHEGFPAWRTVYDWMVKDQTLATAIARARELGQDAIAEDIYNLIGADPRTIKDDQGRVRIDPGYVSWIKVQADIKLKLLAKWNPKRYGDKVELSGDHERSVTVDLYHTVFGKLLENMKTQRQQEQE
jgi:hypothetical protein